RMPEFDSAYLQALAPRDPNRLFPVSRLWQLTNTRFVIGMTGYLDAINQNIDPTNHSFRVRTTFDFAPRDSSARKGGSKPEDITAVVRPDGQFAIFEFGAALPRAKLYATWQLATNDSAVLQQLADSAFDPQKALLVSSPVAA